MSKTPQEILDEDMADLLYHSNAIMAHTQKAIEIASEYRAKTLFGLTDWRSRHANRLLDAISYRIEVLNDIANGKVEVSWWTTYMIEKRKRMLRVATRKVKQAEKKERIRRERQSG